MDIAFLQVRARRRYSAFGRWTDLRFRAAGLPVSAIGWAFGSGLHRFAASSAAAVALAAVAFLGISTGLALLLIGRHLLDRVELARPWQAG